MRLVCVFFCIKTIMNLINDTIPLFNLYGNAVQNIDNQNSNAHFLKEMYLKENLLTSPYLMLIITGALLLLCIYVVMNRKNLYYYFSAFFSFKQGKEERKAGNSIIAKIIFFVGAVFFILFCFNHFDRTFFENNSLENKNFIWPFLTLNFCILIFYIIHTIFVLNLVKNIFDINKNKIYEILSVMNTQLNFLGVMLIVISFLLFFLNSQFTVILIYFGIFLVAWFLVRMLILSISIFYKNKFYLFYFFLYLCIFEILPILILIKYLSVFII